MAAFRHVFLSIATLLSVAGLVIAQPAGQVKRSYNVRDLLAPSFFPPPQPSGSTDAKEWTKSLESQVNRMAAADLLVQILNALGKESWDASNILEITGNNLNACADEPSQQRLARTLANLRKDKPLVRIETWLLTIDPLAYRLMALPVNPQGLSPIFLDEITVQKLLDSARKQEHATLLTAPRITLFNGQNAYIQVATENPYIADYAIHFDKDGKPVFEPKTSSAEIGVRLEVLASTAGADQVVLSLNLRLSELEGMQSQRFKDSPPNQNLMIQVPLLRTSEFTRTVSIAQGMTALAFVPDATPATPTTKPAAKPSKLTLMLIKPTILRHGDQP